MAILAIDTSTSVCVLGIREDDDTFVDETDIGRSHSQEILPRIESLLARSGIVKSKIELIVYGQGPGSFTGLRIGIGVVQGLAYGLNVPVVGVSSLACLANQVTQVPGDGALVALSARNTEVYFGAYVLTESGLELINHEGVFEADAIPRQDAGVRWRGIGNGWVMGDALTQASDVNVEVVDQAPKLRASDLFDLGAHKASRGEQVEAIAALPQYLREQVAQPKR